MTTEPTQLKIPIEQKISTGDYFGAFCCIEMLACSRVFFLLKHTHKKRIKTHQFFGEPRELRFIFHASFASQEKNSLHSLIIVLTFRKL